ncbi:type IV pilus biogenesis protein PilM [Gorillibacterium timonense]|uniref:type IV pilus biogenesis protein PilM n=1 Tax=Gorillibacterium timonense TaxID=1689269 RepID=UPI00071D77DD|nr:pilus assembly protein PilM [Gorillibacterium timonense]
MIQSLWSRIKPGKSVFGMEITEDEVKLCELDAVSSGRLRIVQCASVSLPKGTMNDGRVKDPHALEEAVRELLAEKRWGTNRVHLAIPSQTVLVKTIKMPNAPDNQMEKLIRYELAHHLTLPFEHPHYSYTRLEREQGGNDTKKGKKPEKPEKPGKSEKPGETGNPEPEKPEKLERLEQPRKSEKSVHRPKANLLSFAQKEIDFSRLFTRKASQEVAVASEEGADSPVLSEVLIVAAPMEMLEEYVHLLNRMKLAPLSFEIKAFSLMRLQERCMPLEEDSWIILDVNASNTDLTIVDHGLFRLTRNMEIRFASADSPADDSQEYSFYNGIMSPSQPFENACQDLVSELERLLNFYRYSLDNRHIEFPAIVLTGSLDRMKELEDYLASRMNQRIYRYEATSSAGLFGGESSIDLAAFAVPVGLALRGSRE